MAGGGIYDQLGGGFARYAVDREWVVPHFEKMLYDNALLCRVYAHLWRATGSDLARRVALETADFMVRELRTRRRVRLRAGRGQRRRHRAGTSRARTTSGRPSSCARCWRGGRRVRRRVLRGDRGGHLRGGRLRAATPAARRRGGRRARRLRTGTAAGRARRRPRPGRDDKVVAAWNGLAIAALAETGAYFDRPDLVEAATEAADLLVRVHMDTPRAARPHLQGRRAGATRASWRTTPMSPRASSRWPPSPARASGWSSPGCCWTPCSHQFTAEDGALYDTADDAEASSGGRRTRRTTRRPPGWTAAAGALLSYAAHTGSEPHRAAAERALGVVGRARRGCRASSGGDSRSPRPALDGPREVAVVGGTGDPLDGRAAPDGAAGTAPGAVVAVGEAGSTEVPLLRTGPLGGGRAAAYVCRHFVCDAPLYRRAAEPAALPGRPGHQGVP